MDNPYARNRQQAKEAGKHFGEDREDGPFSPSDIPSKRELQVGMENIGSAVSLLENKFSMLVKQLSPILPEDDVRENEGVDRPEPRTQLGKNILALEDRINRLSYCMSNVIDDIAI